MLNYSTNKLLGTSFNEQQSKVFDSLWVQVSSLPGLEEYLDDYIYNTMLHKVVNVTTGKVLTFGEQQGALSLKRIQMQRKHGKNSGVSETTLKKAALALVA